MTKLFRRDGERKSLPLDVTCRKGVFYGAVRTASSMVEQLTLNQLVEGSSPSRCTIEQDGVGNRRPRRRSRAPGLATTRSRAAAAPAKGEEHADRDDREDHPKISRGFDRRPPRDRCVEIGDRAENRHGENAPGCARRASPSVTDNGEATVAGQPYRFGNDFPGPPSASMGTPRLELGRLATLEPKSSASTNSATCPWERAPIVSSRQRPGPGILTERRRVRRIRGLTRGLRHRRRRERGSSSAVEHRLAKARVASSNLVFRSRI